MQVRAALKLATGKLQESSTPSLDARLLLASALGYSQEELLINYDQELDLGIEQEFFKLVARREAREPIAYILGKQEFYGLDFQINEYVLIPRPDTELIIDCIKEDYASNHSNQSVDILELGVGSGAISVCLAKEIILAELVAVDISDDALKVARDNILHHKVQEQVKVVKSDWYLNLDKAKKYDYIVSNPPYICRTEIAQMSKETVDYEPDLALYADNNGLSSYQAIIQNARDFLNVNGKLILEIGYSQKEAISDLLKFSGFKKIEVKSDLAGLDRVIIAS